MSLFWALSSSLVVEKDPYSAYVILLTHLDGADGGVLFADEKGHTITPILVTTNTTTKKFGSASANCAAAITSTLAVSSMPQIGSSDFTVEGWVYLTTTGFQRFCHTDGAGGTDLLFRVHSGGYLQTYCCGVDVTGGPNVPLNTWAHVAVTRDSSGTVRNFVNGLQVSSASAPGNITRPIAYICGGYSGENVRGLIDEWRVTRGVARYTGNFAPPTAPFPNPANNWSATDKSANITLSVSNTVSTSTDGNIGTFRAAQGVSSGTAVWAIKVDNDNAGDSGAMYLGVSNTAQPLSERVGRNTSGDGWSIVNNSVGAASAWHNNSSSAGPFTFTTGDTVWMYLNMDAGTLGYRKNDGSVTTVFSGITGTVYPTCTIYTNAGQLTGSF
jgi:hypothetical protein